MIGKILYPEGLLKLKCELVLLQLKTLVHKVMLFHEMSAETRKSLKKKTEEESNQVENKS